MAHPNKSKMAVVAIFNLGKMSITPDWIKISAPNLMGRCVTAMRSDHVMEVYSSDVIK